MLLFFFGREVTSALLYVENRRLIEVFPDGLKKLWKDWELRVLILLSLIFQILLVSLGNRRKYIPRTRIRIILWSAYLMADWVAIAGLGIISRYGLDEDSCQKSNKDYEVNHELMSFWAPFLLLHLGGPDTITAYALEDNELWLRHLLALVVQIGAAIYIFLTAWPGSTWLPLISVLILNAGLLKYGERTWALRSANSEHLRDSMLTPPEPGPSYAKFMEEFTLKKAEGFHVTADEVKEPRVPFNHANRDGNDELITNAFDLFGTFKRLFVDLILSFQDRENSQTFFRTLKPEKAFHVIEIELGLAFDMFYTKAPVVYTITGCITRIVSLSSTFSVLMVFSFIIEKSHYHIIDLIITYLLLVVGLLLEIYAVIILLSSDRIDQWLINHNKKRDDLIIPFLRQPRKHWWSNSVAQYNLLSFCLEEKPALCPRIQRLIPFIYENREKHRYKTYKCVSTELKALIFDQLLEFTEGSSDLTALCTHKGSFVLKEYGCHSFNWTTKEEFDQRILIWHIATDLCYYMDGIVGNNPANVDVISNRTESKHLSDYMLYLLVLCPFLLPVGIGMIRFRDTCAEAREFFFPERKIEKKKACQKLLQVNTEVPPAKVKGDRSKSVLFDACRLAKQLRAMKQQDKWKIVSAVWVEMLAHAATHCRGHYHAQQLRKGGELLTHVWLLMAHLGITEQFQIDQGHARAKLIIK